MKNTRSNAKSTTKSTTRSTSAKKETSHKTTRQARLEELFISELKDMLDAEYQIIDSLPELARAAESEDLREAFRTHLQETKNQAQRLNQIFKKMNLEPKRESCYAMKGLIKECEDVIKDFPKSAVRDAALISKAQRVEHYEISVYGTLRSFAKELDLDDAADLLHDNQKEEINADTLLGKLAEGSLISSGINRMAV